MACRMTISVMNLAQPGMEFTVHALSIFDFVDWYHLPWFTWRVLPCLILEVSAHCIWSTFAALLPYIQHQLILKAPLSLLLVTAFHSYPVVEDKSVCGHNFTYMVESSLEVVDRSAEDTVIAHTGQTCLLDPWTSCTVSPWLGHQCSLWSSSIFDPATHCAIRLTWMRTRLHYNTLLWYIWTLPIWQIMLIIHFLSFHAQ